MLTEKQQWAYRNSNARLNIWDGSVSSGKSYCCNFRYLNAIMEDNKNIPPGTIDAAFGKTIGSLRRNFITPIIDLVGQKNAKYYVGKQEFHVFDRVIHTIGANDDRSEGKIRGSTIRKAFGDEITLWPESFFKMMDTRLRTKQSQFFGNTNPAAPNHYLKKEYLNRTGELDLKTFHFTIDDNTALEPDYIKAMKMNFSGLWFKRYILGLWSLAEGVIYDSFDDSNIIDICPPATHYFLSVDYGTNNPFTAILFGVSRFSEYTVWAEAQYYYDSKKHMQQKTDADYANDLKLFCVEHIGPDWKTKVKKIIVDPSALSFKVQLRQSGFPPVKDADNDIDNGIRFVSHMLKTKKYAISKKCEKLIENKYSYVWDSKKQLLGIDAPLKVDDHDQDAERYGLYTEFGLNSGNVQIKTPPKINKMYSISKGF